MYHLWVSVVSGGTELVPAEPLLPNTRYTIVAPAAVEQQREQGDVVVQGSPSITFTTGNSTLAPNEAAAPETKFVALDAEELTNSCVYSPIQACLWTDAKGLYEVRLMNGVQEVQRYLSPAASVTSFELGAPDTVDCVEIRTRDLAGQLSQPAKHCFDDTRLPHLTRTDFPPEALVDCNAPAALAALNGEITADDVDSTTSPDAGTSPPRTEARRDDSVR